MKIAQSYSVIVIPKDKAGIKRWVVSRERIVGTVLLSVGFVLFSLAISLGLVHYHEESMATEELRLHGKQYEKERVQVMARLSELELVVNQNEQLAAKLEEIVGVRKDKLASLGLGGRREDLKSAFQLTALNTSHLQNGTNIFDEHTLKVYNLKTIDLTEEAKATAKRLQDVYKFSADADYFWTTVPTATPVRGWITSDFGMRRSPLTGARQFHEGLDIASPFGSVVTASGDGVVTFAGHHGGLGNEVVVDHGYGLASVYGHNSQLLVHQGEKVKRGQVIARVGSSGRSTGPHLHYEVKVNGVPVDPRRFILEHL